MRKERVWKEEDISTLKSLYYSGATDKAIGLDLGIPVSTIALKRRELGLLKNTSICLSPSPSIERLIDQVQMVVKWDSKDKSLIRDMIITAYRLGKKEERDKANQEIRAITRNSRIELAERIKDFIESQEKPLRKVGS